MWARPEVRHVDVRLIAATNRDLRAEVAAGRFREDLFYRLSTIQIFVFPSLAERLEDIPRWDHIFREKIQRSLRKADSGGLTRRAQAVLLQQPWPGNVRELGKRHLQRFVDCAERFHRCAGPPGASAKAGCARRIGTPQNPGVRPLPLEAVRKEHIERVLDLCSGNRVRAAQMLGIGRTSLYRYLETRRQGALPGCGGPGVLSGPLSREKCAEGVISP